MGILPRNTGSIQEAAITEENEGGVSVKLKPAVAYLVSSYPALSMTFVLREVLHLRRLGLQIDVASINVPDRPPERMTAVEREELPKTYYVKGHGYTGAAIAHLKALALHPGGYGRGLLLAMRLARFDGERLLRNLAYFTEALMVGCWMRQVNKKHLHVHLASQAATVGLFVRRMFRCGFSITLHGPDELYNVESHYLREKVHAADFICCISNYARSQLMLLSAPECWDKLVVCSLGVDTADFAPVGLKKRSDAFEVLCVGRLVPAKGQHILIEAVGRLAAQGQRIRLRLVGDGVDRISLQSLADGIGGSSLVIFEGAANQDRVRELYRGADLFCIPSLAEGVPVVLMEAMAMEIPCVSTHITGIPELIASGYDGLLVAPGDVNGLVEAISLLMGDDTLREKMAKAGRAKILAKYDLSRNVEALSAVFAEHLGCSASGRGFGTAGSSASGAC
jgi:glycosyltransferase involved in cell wall biosynthesis